MARSLEKRLNSDRRLWLRVAAEFNLQRPYEAVLYASLATYYRKPFIFFSYLLGYEVFKDEGYSINKINSQEMPPLINVVFFKGVQFYFKWKRVLREYSVPFNEVISEKGAIRYILDNALVIVPNSEAEAEHLQQKCGQNYISKIQVIYNGSDIDITDDGELDFTEKFDLPESFICCIGGIGPRKNQLSLVEASKNTDIQLVIVGKSSANDKKYEEKIKKMASDNVYFLGELSIDEIKWLLKRAKGHVSQVI